MDGASKFVRGDAIAGIFITVVNVIGGILIGYFQREMAIGEALQSYTILSIGDGLVSQIPAIIISIAASILVTRSSDEANLGEFVGKQLTIYPRAIAISGFLLLLFSVSCLRHFGPFSFISSLFLCLLHSVEKAQAESTIEEVDPALPHPAAAAAGAQHSPSGTKGSDPAQATPESSPSSSATMEKAIEQEVFALEMGYGLLILADKGKGRPT